MDLTLRAARYQFNFVVTEELYVPAFSGSMLRGILGWALMRLGDVTTADIKNKTAQYRYSAYAAVFDPLQCYAVQEIDLHTPNLPVPYVIEAPFNQEKLYQKGEMLSFCMVIMNEGLKHLHTIITAWQHAFLRGVNKGNKGKALLQEVLHLSAPEAKVIYSANKPFAVAHNALLKAPKYSHSKDLVINLNTPMRVQYRGVVLNEGNFPGSVLLRNMVRRFSIYHQLDGHRLPQEQVLLLNEQAKSVESEQQLYSTSISRYSNRQRTKMNLHGVMGSWQLINVPKELLSIIWFCQFLHVGKNTSFGLGGFKAIASL